MPKIPTYKTQGRATTEVGSIRTNIQAPLNTALADVGSTIARYYVAEKQEEAKIKSTEYENQSWNELYNIFDKHKNNPYPTEATNNFLSDVNKYKSNFLNTTLSKENKFTKDAWLQKFENNTSSTLLALNKSSRNELDKKNNQEFENFSSLMSTRIRLDDSYLETVDSDIDAYLFKESDDVIKNKKKKSLLRVKEATILDKQARINPLKLLNDLKQNPNLYPNALEETENAVIKARSILFQNGTKLLEQKLESSYIGEDTGVDSNLILSSFVGQKNYLEVKEELQIADLAREHVKTVLYSDYDTALKSVKDIKVNTTDEKLKQKTINRLESIIQNKQNIISKDGGAEFFAFSDSSIKSSYKDYLSDPNETNLKIYTDKLDGVYEKQAIDEIYRTYLTNQDIDLIDQKIKSETDPNRKIAVIQGIKDTWGEKYISVVNQLSGKIDNNILFASNVDSPFLQKYVSIGKLNNDEKKDLAQRLGNTSETLEQDIIKKVQEATGDFYSILLSQGTARLKEPGKVMEPINTMLKDATLQLLQSGRVDDIDDAVTEIAGNFLIDYDLSNKNFYIPAKVNKKTVSQKVIEATTSLIKSDIKYGRIDLNEYDLNLFGEGGKTISADETIGLIRSDGDWYMDENRGVIFGVIVPSGQFFEVSINDPINPGKKIPLTVDFLNRDGKTKFVSKSGIPLEVDMQEINGFISYKDVYELQQTASP